ncbi:MAG: hypothetical protein AABZ33_08665 [Chloroflexota bacterium]
MGARTDRGLGVLVVRALTEPTGDRPMVVEVLEVDPSGNDRVLLVTSSSRSATRAVRDWLDAQDPSAPERPPAVVRASRRKGAELT